MWESVKVCVCSGVIVGLFGRHVLYECVKVGVSACGSKCVLVIVRTSASVTLSCVGATELSVCASDCV